jgi:acyl-CoA synthetase (NDP forming)
MARLKPPCSILSLLGTHASSAVFPEEAVSELPHAIEYGKWLGKPKSNIPQFPDIRRKKADNLIDKATTRISRRPFWVSAMEASELLKCYGIRMVNTVFASSADEAADKAADMMFP